MAKPPIGVNPLAPFASRGHCKRMTRQDKSRDERLAKALRENLRRRKAQSRQVAETRPPEKQSATDEP